MYNAFDAVFFFGTLFAVMAVGFWTTRRQKTSVSDYFRGGNRLPWYAIGFSMVAAGISSEQFVGEVGYAYKVGLPVVNFEWAVLPGLTILLFIFVPLYVRNNVATMPEYLESRFGGETRTLYAWLSVISYVLVNFALVFYTGGFAIQEIWGINKFAAVWFLAFFTGLYTVYGGLEAMAWTSSIQCVLLMGGGVYVFFAGMSRIGWDVAAVLGTGDRAHLIPAAANADLPWTALIVAALSTNTWYYANNQYINQRCLAAPNEWHAKMGVLFAVFLQLLIPFAVCFPGLIYYVIDPSLAGPGAAPDAHNAAYPRLVAEVVPTGLRGLVAAAIVGAIMSTISGLVNSTSTIFTLDIVQRRWGRDWSEERLVRVGRWSGGIALLIGALIAPIVMHWESIFRYAQDIWALMAAPVVVVFLCGAFWKGTGRRGAIACLWLAILTVPFTLTKSIWADYHGGRFFPDSLQNLENTMVMAGVICIFAWVLMITLADRWPLWLGIPLAIVLGVGVVWLTAYSTTWMAALMGASMVLGMLVPATMRITASRGFWDISMLGTGTKVPWYASIWFWWAVLTTILGVVYWRFW